MEEKLIFRSSFNPFSNASKIINFEDPYKEIRQKH
jgi:hypothetical protein